MYTDSHAHLTDPAFNEDLDSVLERAKEARVDCILNICTGEETLRRGLELKKHAPWIHNVASTTPHEAADDDPFFSLVAKEAAKGNLVAIGETGLDYYYEHSPKQAQQDLFRRYLTLAKECDLPVVIHCRDAFPDFFKIIDETKMTKGVLHCFTGTLEDAKELVKRGWYVSLSGIVTFGKSDALREIARQTPLEHLLIETDAPYLAPQGHRGKRCEPAYVVRVAEEIAKVKKIDIDKVAKVTAENVRCLFSL